MRWLLFSILTSLCLSGSPALGQSNSISCEGGFASVLGGNNRLGGVVNAWTTFDDGTGPQLYAGGSIDSVNGESGTALAKWDGVEWEPVSGLLGTVETMIVHDDGSGPALYLGGRIRLPGMTTLGVLKWDGASFVTVGGAFAGDVNSFEVYDDGSGPELYAGGLFPGVGGISINNIARWDGTSWTRLGAGTNNRIDALEVFDVGQGPELYAGGKFSIAGGQTASRIARWNGASWQAVGGGISTLPGALVSTLQVFDTGAGDRLFVGGFFDSADGQAASGLATWDGSSWTAYDFSFNHTVSQFQVYDAGTGPRLYGFGRIRINGFWYRFARWTGTQWVPISGAPGSVGRSIGVHDDGSGSVVHVVPSSANSFFEANSIWNGSDWSSPLSSGPNWEIGELYRYELAGSSTLIIAGEFESIGGIRAARIAEWDGTQVRALGSGFDDLLPVADHLESITSFDDGTGRELYVGGVFDDAGGVPADSIASWDGQSWSSLGGALFGGTTFSGGVTALQEFDDGSGNALYVGGDFQSVDGTSTGSVAKWDGASWSAVGNMPTLLSSGSRTFAFGVFDDGTGPALYAGGQYDAPDGSGAFDVARWNGNTWSLVPGNGPAFEGRVSALVPFDDGTGEALYSLGTFNNLVGGSSNIARFDGTSWSGVGTSCQSINLNDAQVFDDGSGPALFVAGRSVRVDSAFAPLGAIWSGLSWEPLSSQGTFSIFGSEVNSLEPFEIAGEERLLIGGGFNLSPAGDSHLTSWRGCSPGDDFCFADSTTTPNCAPCPCGNSAFPFLRAGCTHSNGDGARLRSSGSADVLTGDLRFEVTTAVSNSIALLISGTAALPADGSCFVGAGVQTAAFDGLRCVGQGILRHGTRSIASDGSVGTSTPGWGPPAGPNGGIASFYGFVAGQARFFQAIYRDDPAAQCGTGLNTTNGVRVVFR